MIYSSIKVIWYVNPWWISDESTAPSPNPVRCIDFKTVTFDKGVDISSTLTRSLYIYMYNIILQTYAINLLMKMSSLFSDSTKKRKCCQSPTSGEVVFGRKMQRNHWDAKHLNSFLIVQIGLPICAWIAKTSQPIFWCAWLLLDIIWLIAVWVSQRTFRCGISPHFHGFFS